MVSNWSIKIKLKRMKKYILFLFFSGLSLLTFAQKVVTTDANGILQQSTTLRIDAKQTGGKPISITGLEQGNTNDSLVVINPLTGDLRRLSQENFVRTDVANVFTLDNIFNGVTIGRGAGSIPTNTGVGNTALQSNTTGNFNTANGANSLKFNTTGTENTGIGGQALLSNVDGSRNTSIGYRSLQSNTTGSANTANGADALYFNTTGSANTANGADALISNTTGIQNTAIGGLASLSNTVGSNNTAIGYNSLLSNTVGSNNTAIGYNSNIVGASNTIVIGSNVSSSASNQTVIGNSSTSSVIISGIQSGSISDSLVTLSTGGVLKRLPISSVGTGESISTYTETNINGSYTLPVSTKVVTLIFNWTTTVTSFNFVLPSSGSLGNRINIYAKGNGTVLTGLTFSNATKDGVYPTTLSKSDHVSLIWDGSAWLRTIN
jgi:hypothetical protein